MNPVIELIRLEENFSYGTFGVLKINKCVVCVTLEPPDLENAKNISSIPAQQYMMKRTDSPKYGDTFEICDVPGRDHVLMHPGNKVDETEGCILLAEHFGKLGEHRAVLNSGNTFRKVMETLRPYESASLTIHEHF